MTDNRQRVIGRARAVVASWEQWQAASEEDRTVMWGFVERGMTFLMMALDEMDGVDQNTVRPEIMADLERDIAEHGELWKELEKR